MKVKVFCVSRGNLDSDNPTIDSFLEREINEWLEGRKIEIKKTVQSLDQLTGVQAPLAQKAFPVYETLVLTIFYEEKE